MRVQLLLTCLADAFYGEIGIATVRVLESAGCEVVFPEAQTCCGQPAFNQGDRASARVIAVRTRRVFDPDLTIVTPSSSCAAMLTHGFATLGLPPGPPVYELVQFLAEALGLTKWPGRVAPTRIALHDACHGRVTGGYGATAPLLGTVQGIELVPLPDSGQCCGFGGAFAVTHPVTSAGIGRTKLHEALDSGADQLVTGDAGCLLHLRGLIARERIPLRARHAAEVLAEALDG